MMRICAKEVENSTTRTRPMVWVERPLDHRGGSTYRLRVYQALTPYATQFSRFYFPQGYGAPFYLAQYQLLYVLHRASVVIVDDISAYALSTRHFAKRCIFLLCHLDDARRSSLKDKIIRSLFFRRLRDSKRVVTIAPYWQKFLADRGIPSEMIYSPYDEASIQRIRDKGRCALRQKFGFDEKRIHVYVGQCVPDKGIEELVQNGGLKDCIIVTSGIKRLDVPTRHFLLEGDDYYELMKACDVGIFNSKLTEGWNINAMECVLCGTPALMRDRCGMGDLLRMSKQPELDLTCVRDQVQYLLKERERFGEMGWTNLRHLTFNYFKQRWVAFHHTLQ